MATFIKKNGIHQEVTDRLTIKSPDPTGCLDYEDAERMKQIAQMITIDISQTLQSRGKKDRGEIEWREDNPLAKDLFERVDPGAIRLAGAAAVSALAQRWSNMDNPTQRKAEMLAVLAAESKALTYSMEHGWIGLVDLPPFMVTLWGRRF